MNQIRIIQQSIEYIEARLGEELTLAEVAKAMFYSEYHFHRTFLYFVGDTMTSYVRKRRLSQAAELLTHSDLKVLEIALHCGFSSHEAFTRAFRKMYGILPTECRRRGCPPYVVPRANPLRDFVAQISYDWGDYVMQYRIEQVPSMRILGFSLQTSTVEGENHKDIPVFWQKYMREQWGSRVPGKLHPNVELGVCTTVDEDGTFRYIIGFEVDDTAKVQEGLTEFRIPPATYAIFTTPPAGEADFTSSIQQTWDEIFTNWFPSSGYEQVAAPDFEWYDERCWPKENKQIDIYIPVQPSGAKA
ncbi:AraC family transcriptional regulator [Paenibacillus sp. MBLB2552]|uniref:AraC family transcriptional regulator n=1 Tax=Paenibacillus mellifer TaxID=2937794 RepID=A0A9X1Y131_9BACL|nr:AraC family transcriptional regulator [Paenibacillus mellifer]MCK8488952.1 AraC family transcriptional regulator [Paenibacillus mellifer]